MFAALCSKITSSFVINTEDFLYLFVEEFSPQTQGLNYDLKSQSDAFRLTRHSKVYGDACCPVSENKVSVVLSDGRVLFWELTAVDFQVSNYDIY